MARRLLTMLAVVACPVAGQSSPYIRMDHWSVPILEHLIVAGVIQDPSPFARPWPELSIARALANADTSGASLASRRAVRELAHRFLVAQASSARAEAYAGLHWATHGRREDLRPAGDGFIGFLGGVHGAVSAGPVVLSTHPFTDRQIRFDPEYTGVRDEAIPGRLTDAYIALQTPYAEATIGAIDRHWGLPGHTGFLVSGSPYSFEHLHVAVGPPQVRAEILYTQLDDLVRPGEFAPVKRHWSVARAVFTPSPTVVFSVEQATLFLGVGRGFEWRFINPMRLATNTLQDESTPDSINVLYAGNLRVTPHDRLSIAVSLMIDDLASGIGTSAAPDRAGGGIEVALRIGEVPYAFHASAVTALTYRSQQGPEYAIMRNGVGLGSNFADYVTVGGRASLLLAGGWLLTPELVLLWQGEGDFRQPMVVSDPNLVTFFEGTVERTARAAVGWHLGRDALQLAGSLGIHRVWNAEHTLDRHTWETVGTLKALIPFTWLTRLNDPD